MDFQGFGFARPVAALLISLGAHGSDAVAQRVVLDFEGFPGMPVSDRIDVPVSSRLRDQHISAGVRFASERPESPYVAVVDIDTGDPQLPHAPSPVNAIVAVENDRLRANVPIVATFVWPFNPAVPATTNFVSVRADLRGEGERVSFSAYDRFGGLLETVTAIDRQGPVLQISRPGIHRAKIEGTLQTAFDDFTFDSVTPSEPFHRRGDANTDGRYDVSDAIALLGCLYLGDPRNECPDAADANDDGTLDVSDPVWILNWRFLGGATPPPPHPDCGEDPTPDPLAECLRFPLCE